MKFNVITPEQEANLRMKPRSTKTLVGIDGNAFSIIAHMQRNLRRVNWSKEDLDLLMKEMKSGDYQHVIAVAVEFTDGAVIMEYNDNTDDEYD